MTEHDPTLPAAPVAIAPRVRARLGGPPGYAVAIEAGGHPVASDAAVDSGGAGSAPSPGDLLLSALAACTAMTVRLYADRKGWPVEDVRVDLDKVRERAEPGHPRADGAGYVTRIRERTVIEAPALDAEQLARLHDVATKCPVRRTLQAGVEIEDLAADAAS